MAASAWLKKSILSRCVYKCALRFYKCTVWTCQSARSIGSYSRPETIC